MTLNRKNERKGGGERTPGKRKVAWRAVPRTPWSKPGATKKAWQSTHLTPCLLHWFLAKTQ